MSNVSTTHSLNLFDSKKSQALSGQRLAKIGYKSTEKTPAKYPSVCASVPFIDTPTKEQIDSLMPAIKNLLSDTQDKIIRSLYESSNGTRTSINDAEIGIDQCIGYLTAEAVSGRLTKESITSWFDSDLKDNLYLTIGVKIGFIPADAPDDFELSAAQAQKLEQVTNGYRDMLAGCAAGATMYATDKIASLKRALELSADTAHPIVERVTARLDAMSGKVEEFLL